MTKETIIVKDCIRYLTLKGYEVIRNNSGAVVSQYKGKTRLIRYGAKGSSDILACSPKGQFVAVECKSEKGKPTDDQITFLKRIDQKGGIALIVHSLDELMKALP